MPDGLPGVLVYHALQSLRVRLEILVTVQLDLSTETPTHQICRVIHVTHLQILLEKVADPGVGKLQEEGLSAQCTAVCPEPVLPAHLGQLL